MLDNVLETRYLGNPVATWLIALGVLVASLLALVLARRIAIRRLEKFALRTSTIVDDLALGALRRTRRFFLFVLALTIAAKTSLQLPSNVQLAFELLAKVAVLLQLANWGNGAITFWLDRVTATKKGADRASLTTLNVLGIVARIVLWVLIALVALDAFGVNVTGLITGLGIAGVAVALAVQNILGDLIASLSIALDKPFVIGDTINVDTFTGTVEHIGLKSTRLRSLSGEQIVMSNAELLKARIRNFQRQLERRVVFTLSLQYDTPADLVERVPGMIKEIVQAQPETRLDRSHFSAFADSALLVETVYFVTTADYGKYMDTQQRINLAIMRRFAEHGIEFAFPTRTVVVRGNATADGAGINVPAAAGGA
jgi:small-conductance mechanosensitive channel